jgi:hypothetical protein
MKTQCASLNLHLFMSGTADNMYRILRQNLWRYTILLLTMGCITTNTPPPCSIHLEFYGAGADSLAFIATSNCYSNGAHFEWFVDSAKASVSSDSLKWKFAIGGLHVIQVRLLNTTGRELATATDSFEFAHSGIIPDGLAGFPGQNYLFRALFHPAKGPYELVWNIDGATFIQFNSDTISYIFRNVGSHSISAVLEDTVTGSALMSAATTATISLYPMSITVSPARPNIGDTVTITGIHAVSTPGLHYNWSFGDGTAFDTTAKVVRHVFLSGGDLPISVILKVDTTSLARTDARLSINPKIGPFDASSLSSFHRAIVSFSGAHSWAGDYLSCFGSQFSFSDSITVSSEILYSTDGRFAGRIRGGIEACDSLVCTITDNHGGCYTKCPPQSLHSESGTSYSNFAALRIMGLPVVSVSADSIVFGFSGPECRQMVVAQAMCSAYDCMCGQGSGEHRGYYTGTNWTTKPEPQVRVVLLK